MFKDILVNLYVADIDRALRLYRDGFGARMGALRAVVRLVTLLLAIAISPGAAHGDDEFSNATLLTRPDGSRVLAVNWAVGTPAHVRILQIPEAYLGPLMGEALCHPFGAQVDPDCQQNFMLTALLRVTVPEGAPPSSPIDAGGVATVKLTSVVRASDPTGASFVSSKIADDLDKVRAATPRLRVLPQLIGLRGYGLGKEVDPASSVHLWIYSDIYFDGPSPQSSTVAVECTDPEADRRFGINSPTGDDAICIEYFALPRLSAVVTVSTTRRHILEWQKIRTNVSTAIVNFLQG